MYMYIYIYIYICIYIYTSGLPSISIDNVVLLQWRLVAFEGVLDLLCGSVGPLYVGGMQHLQKFWPVVVTSMLWWKIVVKLALEWRFWRLLGVNVALERRFQGPLAVTLAMEWRFQGLLAVKLALERWFRERLGAWRDPKGAPGCRKECPIAPEWTPRGRKLMRSGPWKPKKRTLSRSSLRYQSWNVFLSICGVFAKSAKPLKYRACQQKQGLGPLRCGPRWNLKNHRKCDGFRGSWTSG